MSDHTSASDPRPVPSADDWAVLLRAFRAAPVELVAQRELQRRTDSKFVVPASAAAALLPALTGDYALLAAGETQVATYRTLYFDTSDLALFHAHRRGRRVRHKVRIRHYPDRHVSALEVKTRLGARQTAKARRPRTFGDNVLSASDDAFVGEHIGSGQRLVPQVWTEFRRITLLALEAHERVTIDVGLKAGEGPLADSLRTLAIVEVKQAHFARRTPVMQAMRAAGWTPSWVSKFCTAIVFEHPDVRRNGLIPGLRALQEAAA